ncbi:MAG: hypothetical protein SGJ20_02590 [Planctomycetota bacterium]|nr:hypothetical protein [Planctomycetota bacterium]
MNNQTESVDIRCKHCRHRLTEPLPYCPACGGRNSEMLGAPRATKTLDLHPVHLVPAQIETTRPGVPALAGSSSETTEQEFRLEPAAERAAVYLELHHLEEAPAKELDQEEAPQPRSFSLATLMLAMTLFSVCFAVATWSRFFGMTLFILSATTLIRAAWVVGLRRGRISSFSHEITPILLGQSLILSVMSLYVVGVVCIVLRLMLGSLIGPIDVWNMSAVASIVFSVIAIVSMTGIMQLIWPAQRQ